MARDAVLESNRYTFLLFLVSLNILLAIIVESFLRVKQEKWSVSEIVTVTMSDDQVGPKAFIEMYVCFLGDR